MTSPGADEIGAKLVLSGRSEFAAGAKAATEEVTKVGKAAETAGIMAAKATRGFNTFTEDAKKSGIKATESFTTAGKESGRRFGRGLTSSLSGAAGEAGRSAHRLGTHMGEKATEGFKERFKDGVKTLAGPLLGIFAAGAAGDFIKEGIHGANQNRIALRMTGTALKSTGGSSGQTIESVTKLAEELGNVNAQSTAANIGLANMLLVFPHIKGKVFEETAKSADDLAARFKIGLPQAARMLGKVLEDPAKSLNGLSRLGIRFDAEQTKQIKTWVAHGQTAKAQGFILEQVNKRVGGSAAASVTPGMRLHHVIEELSEKLGKKLIPLLDKLANWTVKKVVPALMAFGTYLQKNVWPIIKTVFEWVDQHVIPILKNLATFIENNRVVFTKIILVVIAVIAVFKTITIVMGIFNTVMDANPVTLLIAAIALLVVGVIYAYKHFKWFRDFINGVWGVIKTVFNWIKDHWHLLLDILLGPFGFIIGWVADHFGGITDTITTVVKDVIAIGKKIGDGIKWAWDHSIGPVFSAIMDAIGKVKDAYNWLFGDGKGTGAPGSAASLAAIPKLPAGGIPNLGGLPNLLALNGVPGATSGKSPSGHKPVGSNAGGTNNWSGGLTWVGEGGRELVDLPRGSKISSNSKSERILAAANTVMANSHRLHASSGGSVPSRHRQPGPPVHLHVMLNEKEIASAVYRQIDHDTAYMESV